MPISVKPNGEEKEFGDETGTPEFYMVHDTLLKYLGEENVWVNWDYNDFIFIIENKFEDECFDISYDYKKIIEEIYEPFAPFNFVYMKQDHLKFQIISDM